MRYLVNELQGCLACCVREHTTSTEGSIPGRYQSFSALYPGSRMSSIGNCLCTS